MDASKNDLGHNPIMFTYTPLQDAASQIRLLRVHPGVWGSVIRCDLDAHAFSTAPSWTAISYTWGSPEPKFSISVNGRNMTVRQNCLYALEQVRHRNNGEGYIWLDAICINQEDVAEKGNQVAMMGEIYEQADFVLCCVGPSTDGTECLLNFVAEIEMIAPDVEY